MAGTLDLGTESFPPPNDAQTVQFGADFNDSLQLISLWCNNNGQQNAFCEIAAVDVNGVQSKTAVYGQSFPPGRTVIAIPNSPANAAIVLAPNPAKPGKYTGVNVTTSVPG